MLRSLLEKNLASFISEKKPSTKLSNLHQPASEERPDKSVLKFTYDRS